MKKILPILFFSLILSGNARATIATCFAGECEFFPGLWYSYAETICMQPLRNEEVDQGPLGFEIIATGEFCMVFNERD
tara:strand:- start:1395 stop:1628 length:234 start_codon:yes stop_codon:yes gene_type:complete